MESELLIISEFFIEIEVGDSRLKCPVWVPWWPVEIGWGFLEGEAWRLFFPDFLIVELNFEVVAFLGELPPFGVSNSIFLVVVLAGDFPRAD